jgi:gas vesicle protein
MVRSIQQDVCNSKNHKDNQGENIMVKENNVVKNHDNNILGVLGGIMIGGLAGAVTMLLLAPQSGKRTRMQIRRKSTELLDQTSEMLEDTVMQLRADGRKFVMGGRRKAKALMYQGQDLVADQMSHVSDVVQSGKKAIQSSIG